jgi:nucleoid-associated protein YgaU
MTQIEIQATPGGATPSRFGLRLLCRTVLGLMLVVSGSPVATTAAQQDAAEAARQARAQKQSDAARPSHVYTNDDLTRQEILTPADRSRFVAARAPETSKPETQAAATSAPAEDVPLGDVARYYRAQREEQARADARPAAPTLQAKSFPLLASSTPLAAMKQPVAHTAAPATSVWPTRKRDPFVHAQLPLVAAPTMVAGANASNAGTEVTQPAKRIDPAVAPAAKLQTVRPTVTAPVAQALARVASPRISSILVAEGDTLWSISRRFLGSGTRWKLIIAVNPGLEDPRQLRAGMQLILPAPKL